MDDIANMRLAIDVCRRGIAAGNSPFGAAVVRGEEVVAVAHNTVIPSLDSTAHAEVNAIRVACRAVQAISLAGCTLYSTCEPCPMCLSACHWARLERVVYGVSIEDSAGLGFGELFIPAAEMVRLGASALVVEAGPLREECRELFREWRAGPAPRTY